MRIHEIIFPNNEPAERNCADPPAYEFDNDLADLAGAFTKGGAVKHFWYLNSLERQSAEPASPTAPGTELVRSGNLEPAITSWEADPGLEEPYAAMPSTQPNRPAAVAKRASVNMT